MNTLARALATEHHSLYHLYDADQSPALEHITQVAGFVGRHGGDDAMIAAAWLHDIVEDTEVTLEQVEDRFGTEVAGLVDGLTDPDHFEAMPLEQRKRLQAQRIRSQPDRVKCIKLCDQLSNVLRIMDKPPTDWDERKQWTYVQGARAIARECNGLWPELDTKFDQAYERATKHFGRVVSAQSGQDGS
mgnify:FL=1